MFDSNATLAFTSDTDCDFEIMIGGGRCTYEATADQVSITITRTQTTYVFQMRGNQMAGNVEGAGVVLAKQA